MHILLVNLLSFALFAQSVGPAPGRVVTVDLPKTPGTGEMVWIELKVGIIERGAEIEIMTTAGQSLGVISPFGIRSGDKAGTYTVPLPPDAISNDRVKLRLILNQYGHAKRAPTAKEVKGIRLKITRAVL